MSTSDPVIFLFFPHHFEMEKIATSSVGVKTGSSNSIISSISSGIGCAYLPHS